MGKDLIVIWAGISDDIQFTYRKDNERDRRTITPTEFGYDSNKQYYIKGICNRSNEERTFKTSRIETKIQVDSKKYTLQEWQSTL